MRRLPNRFVRTICAPRPSTTRSRRRSLVVQSLEDRTTPAQFLVTSLADDGGAGTLRVAINSANAAGTNDEIVFDEALFGAPGTITLATGVLPTIAAGGGNLTITGPGKNLLTIDAGGTSQVFVSDAPILNMSGMRVINGLGTNVNGGGLLAANTVVLDGMEFSGNRVTGTGFNAGSGGGVSFRANAAVVIRNSTVSGNTAAQNGGGAYFYFNGSLLLLNSTISGNSTTEANNSKGGGGLYFYGSASSFQVINSTIASNTSGSSGGAINLRQASGTFSIVNSTIVGNSAANTAAGQGGGGLAVVSGTAAFDIANSIITGNTAAAASNGPDIRSANTVTVNYTAMGDPVNGFTLSGGTGNLTGTPASFGLGALADNGGTTLTMAPAAGSALIDAGRNASIPTGVTNDQRGRGWTRTFPSRVDMGSLEVQPPGLPFAEAETTDVVAPTTVPYEFTVTYEDPNGTNNGLEADTVLNNNLAIRVTGPNGFDQLATYVGPSTLVDGEPMTITYSITPPGGGWDVSEDGFYTVSVEPNQIQDLTGNFVMAGSIGVISVVIPQNLVVTNTNDSGPGSLRDAMDRAANIPSDDTISFDATVFGVPQTISLQTELPFLFASSGALDITGPGMDLLTVERDAGAATQFRVLSSYGAALTMSDFTISGGVGLAAGLVAFGTTDMARMQFTGNASDDFGTLYVDAGQTATLIDSVVTGNTSASRGGGIFLSNYASLTMEGTTVSNNTAGSRGGGVFMARGATLIVRDSEISGNTASAGPGGGIFAYPGSTVVVERSTISGNSATSNGGGIYFFSGGNLAVRDSTISGNTTSTTNDFLGGGGIYFFGSAFSPIEISNSTIAGNSSAGSGGAILLRFFFGELNVVNSTISGNVAASTTVGTYYTYGGGGITDLYGFGIVNIRNSVISGNTNANSQDVLSPGDVNVYSSLIFDANGFTIANGGNNIAPGTDPVLGALQDNGGPTLTISPLVGSPLIDAADPAFVTGTTDQRGLDRIDGANPDIGSVEAQPAEVTIEQGATQADPTNQTTVVFDVEFDQAVTGFEDADVQLSGTAPGTLSAAVSGSGRFYTVTVTGMTGDGTVVANVVADAALNLIGQNSLASTSTDNSITVDYTRPTVTINQATGQADPINTGPLLFDVVFSEAVVGLDPADVVVTSSIGDPLVVSVTPGIDPSRYQVSISGMTGTSTVTATIPAGGTTDLAGNLNFASTSTDNSIVYDVTQPTVAIDQASGQGDPGGGVSVTFDVVFSEAVTGFTGADIDFTGSTAPGSLGATVSGSGAAYTVTVTGMTAGGLIVASIPAATVTDLAGNDNLASTSTDNSVNFILSGTVQFDSATYVVNEVGTPSLLVTVTRVGGTEGPLSVNYTTVDGTAIAGTNYTTTSGTFSWADGETTSRTFNVPLLDDGVFTSNLQFGLALNTISLSGALGAPAAATVTIRTSAAIEFTAANFAVLEEVVGGTVTVTVKRSFQSVGAVSVNYAISAGTATLSSDFGPAGGTGTLTWADGDMTDKEFIIPILDDTLSEGRETILLTLSGVTGNASLGAQATATVTIAHSEGKAAGTQFTDADGDLVTPRLAGKVGTLTYYLTNGVGPISEIVLSGTESAKSVVTLAIKKPAGASGAGIGRVQIGEIVGIGTAGVRALNLPRADLVGAGINLGGFLGALNIGDIKNGADIILTGAAPPLPRNAATRITALVIEDGTDINVTAPLGNVTATAIGNGTITAPIAGAITVKGRKANRTGTITAIPGDFKSDLTLSGAGLINPVKQKALKSLNVAGTIDGATIDVGGNVGLAKAGAITNTTFDVDGKLGPIVVKGAVTGSTFLADGNVSTVNVGSFVNSRLFAGYTGPDNGTGTFTTASTIGPFIVKSKTDGFANSYVIATNFKNITLASADTTNGGTKFGFVYKTNFAGLTLKVGTVTKKYDKVLGGTQDIEGDLRVTKVV